MIESIFNIFYDVVQKEQIDGLEFLLTAILSQLINELETPPRPITKIVLSHLLRGEPQTNKDQEEEDGETNLPLAKKKKKPVAGRNKNDDQGNTVISFVSRGYNVSKTVCMDNIDIMTRVVNQYVADILNPILLHTSNNSSSTGSEDLTEDIEKLGNLVIAVWKAVPELLVNVLGQLEQNMSIENTALRYMSTRVIGEIICFEASRINFITEYNAIFKTWIGRYRDVSPKIRINWANTVPNFVKNQTNHTIVLESVIPFLGLLEDPDEKVRIAVCKALANVDIDTIATTYATVVEQPLAALADRLRDKKSLVRLAAFQAVGKIYDEAYEQIAAGNLQISDVSSWIPSHILGLLYVNDLEINEHLDWVLFDYIYPFEQLSGSDSEEAALARARRLLTIVKALNEESFKAFTAISSRQVAVARYLNAYLEFCKQYHDAAGITRSGLKKSRQSNGGNENSNENPSSPANRDELSNKINSLIKWVASVYPDSEKVHDHLTAFFKSNDRQAFKLFGICINPDSDYKSVYDSYHSLMDRLSKSSSLNSIEPTIKSILYRSAFILFNKTNVSAIINISRSATAQDSVNLKDVSYIILKEIAAIQPGLIKSQSQDISLIIENASPGDKGLVDTLKTARLLFGKFPDLVPSAPAVWRSLLNIAKTGSIKEAKHATNVLDFAPKKNTLLTKLVEGLDVILSGPYEDVPENFSTVLSCIAQLYYHNPQVIEPYSGLVISFLLRHVLLSNKARPAKDDDPDWVDDSEVNRGSLIERIEGPTSLEATGKLDEHLQRKLLALRIMVNRARSPYLDEDSADEVAKPILNLLMTLLVHNGELNTKDEDTPPHYKSRLRLEACVKILKLSQTGHCLKRIGPAELNVLGVLIRDSQLQVRDRFILKLTTLLSDGSIPERFLCLVFFVAGESNKMLSNYCIRWIKARAARQVKSNSSSTALENSFVRFLHVLAHSGTGEEYEEGEDDNEQLLTSLSRAAKYIIFFLKLIATESNISLLLYLSQRIKEYKDVVSQDSDSESSSSGLYTVADLAQICVLEMKKTRGWVPDPWPGKISLPADSFEPIESTEEAQRVFRAVYIPDNIDAQLRESISKEFHHHAKVKPEPTEASNGRGTSAPKKRTSQGSSSSSVKTKKPKAKAATKFKSLTRASEESVAPRRSSRVATKKVNYMVENSDNEDEENEEEEEESNSEEDEEEEGSDDGNDTDQD
ncbi:Pds5p [Sugiyamaella lignohabitans]|uniref:Pds5p n=1 Tax=Sugiyamaella lignohabitans TaxID=796027 RepID=A0A167C194_9ASCO|nr:Pds5p [Sugiyamaella lignohabitans]ANB11094.1 Pds5p [Sugiyamaella lignohabitans]